MYTIKIICFTSLGIIFGSVVFFKVREWLLNRKQNKRYNYTDSDLIQTEPKTPPKNSFEHNNIISEGKQEIISNNINQRSISPENNPKDIKTNNPTEIREIEAKRIFTTGENAIYKELLKDERWIKKSEEIKKRDFHVCKNCNNIRRLNTISDLYELASFAEFEVLESVVSLFSNFLTENEYDKKYFVCNEGEVEHYIPKYNLFSYYITKDFLNSDESILLASLDPSFLIVSSHRKSDNPLREVCIKDFSQYAQGCTYNYNIRTVFVKGNSTEGKIYLSYTYGTQKGLNVQRYEAVLIKDENIIIFPLKRILSCTEQLEVHHLKYAKSHNPWDVSDKFLITLCHSCHIGAHIEANKKTIPLE